MLTATDEFEFQAEAENRIRNLMWTVSGDYALDTKVDTESYFRSKYICLYDAVKQGAFARFFDKNEFGMYLVKKVYCGAQEQPLTELAQLCVDAAVYKKAAKERPGVVSLRKKAFEDVLELSFERMSKSLVGRLKIALMRGYLDGRWECEKKLMQGIEKIRGLEHAQTTAELIEAVDALYNTLLDQSFEKKHGALSEVLDTTLEDLQEFDWREYLEEESLEDFLEEYLKRLNSRIVSLDEMEDEEEKEKTQGRRRVVVIDEKAAAKMYSYIELNYGKTYLNDREQKSMCKRLCHGAHADCSLYFTDGILKNPVLSNAQYVNAKRHSEKNRVMYRNNKNMIVAVRMVILRAAAVFLNICDCTPLDFSHFVKQLLAQKPLCPSGVINKSSINHNPPT